MKMPFKHAYIILLRGSKKVPFLAFYLATSKSQYLTFVLGVFLDIKCFDFGCLLFLFFLNYLILFRVPSNIVHSVLCATIKRTDFHD